ncbi:Serine/threonine-protein kinase SMG1 [Dillenia turbinata]|uniref:non-specific serine/threonine protein kinase n=1 Tax=Dillenia turbinata TaxID=194707 RepID=A0AAN8WD81_9MAGN
MRGRSYGVRQAAATAYGALCSMLCSIPIASNGRQNQLILGSLVDRFISWALPLLSNVSAGDGSTDLALESLREFLNIGDVGALGRYSLPILKACQELLEDERTSLNLLHRLLGVLTLISIKFRRSFQPHFVDIVDLLLGWALVPDLDESDRRVIMDIFLQFQKHWVGNLQFSLGLLSKFLGDMDVLLQDGSPGTPKKFRRLLALLSCFLAILQSTASGMLEINMLEQIIEPLSSMVPHLLGCLSMVGGKFGWANWIEDSWRCLTLLAEIMSERFATFYPLAVDILFKSLEMGKKAQALGPGQLTAFQVHGVLKTNLQLLSLQKFGLLPSFVQRILQFGAPISQLRLHPNHLVTASSAATYIFLLQHGNNDVVEQAMASIFEELELLKSMLAQSLNLGDLDNRSLHQKPYSDTELISLVKFDLKVLLSCVSLVHGGSLSGQLNIARSEKAVQFMIEKLNPFELPIQAFVDLQVNVMKILDRLSAVEFLSISLLRNQSNKGFDASEKKPSKNVCLVEQSAVAVEHLRKYGTLLVKALDFSSPLSVKLEALDWICRFCKDVTSRSDCKYASICFCKSCGSAGVVVNLLFSVLRAASDKEPKVRSQVEMTLELLLQAKVIHPSHLYTISEIVLERLGDPDSDIKHAFVKMLSHIVPITVYTCGLLHCGIASNCRAGLLSFSNRPFLNWKQVFALKQLPQQLRSQQLVSILSFISQRWKVPLSSWIQRLVNSCRNSKAIPMSQAEGIKGSDSNYMWLDVKPEEDILPRVCSVNNLAGAWWAIHEAARYCVAMRLRTNLGGPTQTFAALERMLLDIAQAIRLDSEQNDRNLNIISYSGVQLLPMRLLLDFVEALKKNVYNAYEGSFVLPCPSRQSTQFFRANKKVCEEWFSRICEPMMNAGLALQSHDAIIYYCTLRLQELKNLVVPTFKDKARLQVAENLQNNRERSCGDILSIVRHMALALCRSHESEALVGLQKWVSSTFSSLFSDECQSLSSNGISGPFSWITGLVYQAEGKYEKAAAYFTHLLQSEDSLSVMGSDGVQFAIARIIESYSAVTDWKSLESWLLELQGLRAKHAGKSYSGALTTAGNEVNAIHALARFDDSDYQAAWAFLDLTPKSSSELTLDPKLAMQRSEQMLLQALLLQREGRPDKVSHELQKAKSMLEETLSVLPLDGLVDSASYAMQLHCIFAFEDGCQLGGSQDKLNHREILSSYVDVAQFQINRDCQDCSPWLKLLRVYQSTLPTSMVSLNLCKNLLSLARKQRNLLLANRLSSYLRDHSLSCSDEKNCDLLISSLRYESILLMYAENRFEDAFTNLWSYIRSCMVSSATHVSEADDILKAKACLKLSSWLRKDYPDMSLASILLKMRQDFNGTNPTDIASLGTDAPLFRDEDLSSKDYLNLIIEEIVGTATKTSTRLCPTLGKSWISYAFWCYSQAQGSFSSPNGSALCSCSFSPVLVPEVVPDRFKLTEVEISRIKSILLQLSQEKVDIASAKIEGESDHWHELAEDLVNANKVDALVRQIVMIIETAAGMPGVEESSSVESPRTIVRSQLHMFLLNAIVSPARADILSPYVEDLLNVWLTLRRRRVSLFGHAACGFMQFLAYSSPRLCSGQLAGSSWDVINLKTGNFILRATLYVLHILLNFGLELQDTLENVLSTVPLYPWQEVVPQLFARLSTHSELVIRKQLEGILMMLAKLSPWSIVYPTLVDINSCEEKPTEELQHILVDGDRLLIALVIEGDFFENNLYPRLIQDVQLMINELGNVTVLWEELWLSTLQDLHPDVMRRINLLKEEAARIAENVTLTRTEKNKISAAKYSAMMAPILVSLERRLVSTSRKPETPHELWFQQEYGEQLKSAILAFKNPPASAASLGEVWRPFENIAASLASYQRKSSISLGEVAPALARLSQSDVPMPGLEKQFTVSVSEGGLTSSLEGIVTIVSYSEQVAILPTKTKPKKLVIQGSDGQNYTYLLKGREDLRLDARIMQLLQAINDFLQSSHVGRSHSLGIRYYSVTPISGRAGLIQWVDDVISIYSVFKSWQNRVQMAQLSALGASNAENSVHPSVPRPSDMFYGKIIPALKEKGIRRVISRRDWPHEVKRKVLLELMKEVPAKLVHQELWCASEGFKAFSSKLKRYSGSVAAMSMVGHVLGLGDRHLDNILMDFSTGDIVHIDYNVCFDKGKRLKVPEIVPFRLTQTIEAALGLTGIEGTFRANCEAVVDILRKNKDIILMLLEVFVWDPLVEWTREDFLDDAAIGGEERKGMELAVSLSLFASRVQEIRVPLQEHHDLLLATLPTIDSALERFADVLNQYELISAIFYRVDQERSNLLMHETSAKSMVAEATSNSDKAHALFEIQAREFTQAKAMVAEKAQEATTWMEKHGKVLDALRSNSFPEIKTLINLSSMGDSLSLISAVVVAGVPLTIVPEPTQAQCQDIDREVSQVISELDHGISSAVTALQAYSLALQRVLPLNYPTTSPVHSWAQVLQLSLGNVSPDILSLARRQASELVAQGHEDGLDFIKGCHKDLCSKVENYALEIQKVEEECAELMSSIGLENESNAKDRLLTAFSKYMRSAGFGRTEEMTSSIQLGQFRYNKTNDSMLQPELEEKKQKVISVLYVAVSHLYTEVRQRVVEILIDSPGQQIAENRLQSDFGTVYCQLEEQVEKCLLVAGFVNEVEQFIGQDAPNLNTDLDCPKYSSERNCASIFKASFLTCKNLVVQMTDFVLPDLIRSIISFNSDAMDAFGTLSQIRGSVDTALEQLIEVELERASLAELEQNYFVKVGLITEQQLALEEAAVKGRDHLSWEEAEELASQEEACRAQLDQLHQSWNQKDLRISALIKREASARNALVSSEHHLRSLSSIEQERESLVIRSKALLAALGKPFLELETIDKVLSSFSGSVSSHSNEISIVADLLNSGYSISECIWKFVSLLQGQFFFAWKVGVMDSFLDSCVHDVASSVDMNLGFDLLFNVVRKKLEIQLQEHVVRYLKERVASALLAWLDKEREHLKQRVEVTRESSLDQERKDMGAVKRVQIMLDEYCNAHETARAARSAASLMKRQVKELKEALRKTSLEIVQMEWMYDVETYQNNRVIFQKFLAIDDDLSALFLNLSRAKFLESLKSAASNLVRSVEGLQSCELHSVTAEGQLERAMGWACGGPNTSSTGSLSSKSSGIPPEFHDHLMRRRKLLWEARGKAADIIKICMSVLEFEASRDGVLRVFGDSNSPLSGADGRTWQQSYLNALTRLDVTYHAFTHAEQEWKLAHSSMEAASSGFFSATNELCVASVKAKSVSGDLQTTLIAMRDRAYEASDALSAFCQITKGHTALTSECGSMLEEVLAITEGLDDFHSLGKDAAVVHSSLMDGLSKASAILIPLESVLSKDVAAMTDAMAREQETKMEISPIHGQAIYQSYFLRIREAYQQFRPLVPSLTFSVKGLLSMLIRLARTASIHAGTLHKALEGLGESQEVRIPETNLSAPDLEVDVTDFDSKDGDELYRSNEPNEDDILGFGGLSLQDKEWISPPDSICSSSTGSGISSSQSSHPDICSNTPVIEQLSCGSNRGEATYLNSGPFSGNDHDILHSSQQVEVNESDSGGEKLLSNDPNEKVTAVASANDESGGPVIANSHPVEENHSEVKLAEMNEASLSNAKVDNKNQEAPLPNPDAAHLPTRGKNAYAMSVLKRIQMKIDGKDIAGHREITVAEQVDYLLKQATSVDNLCNILAYLTLSVDGRGAIDLSRSKHSEIHTGVSRGSSIMRLSQIDN